MDKHAGRAQTDSYYRKTAGYSYDDETVDRWLHRWFVPMIRARPGWRVLDLACGDGAWSFGLLRMEPSLEITGVDFSEGAIESASARAEGVNNLRFMCADLEDLPTDLEGFDLIFGRGIPLLNQHDMTHQGCLDAFRGLHQRLVDSGRFYTSYAGRPHLEGSYTPSGEMRLPLNRFPRRTRAVQFSGGKYNHSQASFLAPFLSLPDVDVESYRYRSGRHACATVRRSPGTPTQT